MHNNIKQSFKLLLLLFFFIPLSSEWHHARDSVPTVKIDFNDAKSESNISWNINFKVRPLSKFHQNSFNSYNHAINNNKLPTHISCEPVIYKNVSALQHIYGPIQLSRNGILKQFTRNYLDAHTTYFKQYFIAETTQRYLDYHKIDLSILDSCNGNLLQQAVHQEFLILADTAACLWNKKNNSLEVKQLTSVIADFTNAGTLFNHEGEVTKAIALADAGWAILDCIQAAGEGIVEGLALVAYDIIHPIQTIQNFTHAVSNCGHYLHVVLKEIDFVESAILDGKFDIAYDRYTLWSEHCSNIAQALNEHYKKLALRDVVKGVATSAVQMYATGRALNGLSKFFNYANQNALHVAQKINNGFQESVVLMTAEGIPIRIAQETLKYGQKVPRAQDKLLQVLSQFESHKIKVGKITFLLDKKGLKHILERHHPKYWNGSIKPMQTFLNEKTTTNDIVHIIKKVIKQNRKLILEKGTLDGQIDGIVKNIKYRVGFKIGKIGQFYIPLKQ